MKTQKLTLALLLGCCGVACAALPPGISGAWYTPAPSGHGISLEILDDRRALACWYAHDAAGEPMHLYIDGRIQGHAITGPAYLSRDVPFDGFDQAQHTIGVWGHVHITFQDRAHANLHYDADGPRGGASYGSGDIAMTRLTQLAGLDCVLSDTERLPAGLYNASVDVILGGVIHATRDAVDPHHVPWAAHSFALPGLRAMTGMALPSIVIAQVDVGGDRDLLRGMAYGDSAFRVERGKVEPLRLQLLGNGGKALLDDGFMRLTVRENPVENARIARELDMRDLAARMFATELLYQFASDPTRTRISANGELCIEVVGYIGGRDCSLRATIVSAFAGSTFFTFAMHRRDDVSGNPYRGRGWVEYGMAGAERVVLMGDNARGQGIDPLRNRG